MAVTEIQTNLQICRDALRKIGVVAIDEEPTGNEIEVARRSLERMLKAWQSKGYMLWSVTGMAVTLTTAASYSLTPARPLQIQNVNLRRSGIDMPMLPLTRDEYDRLPNKAATGTPTQFYYDRQKEAGTLYVWPALSSAAGETLQITYVREQADVVLAAEADIPGEWWDAAVYGLAARLADDFAVNVPNVVMRAERELDEALAGDREGSVFFCSDDYR